MHKGRKSRSILQKKGAEGPRGPPPAIPDLIASHHKGVKAQLPKGEILPVAKIDGRQGKMVFQEVGSPLSPLP